MELISPGKSRTVYRPVRYLAALWVIVLLAGCSDSAEKAALPKAKNKVSGDIYLAPDSPKKAYIKTARLTLSPKPLLEPIAGKIALDESRTSRIGSPVAGRVISSPLALGDFVKAGTPLLELDSPDVAAAEADFAKAQADLTLARRAYQRQLELYQGKAAPRKDLEQAQDILSQARSEAKRAQDRLRNLHIDSTRSDGRFTLRSPVSGVVLERKVNPGMEVRPDLSDPLYVISDLDRLSLLMEIFEVNLAKIQLGQSVLISVPAYPGRLFPASVQYIGQELDETTRTILVRCELPNPDRLLLPGMYATVNIQSGPNDQAIVIPLTSVYTEDQSDYVFIAVATDHFQRRRVQLGLRLKDKAVVEAGLRAGEQLVFEGALMLRTDEAVEENAGE